MKESPPPHPNVLEPCEKLKKKQENEPWNWSDRNTTPHPLFACKDFLDKSIPPTFKNKMLRNT